MRWSEAIVMSVCKGNSHSAHVWNGNLARSALISIPSALKSNCPLKFSATETEPLEPPKRGPQITPTFLKQHRLRREKPHSFLHP